MSELFTIEARAPLAQAGDGFFDRLSSHGETYTITADVGFDTASLTVSGGEDYLLDWFRNGLARDVLWVAPDSSTAWHGFVSDMSLALGSSRRSRSLNGMANRIHYLYTALDTSTNPPTAGAQATTTVNDTTNQTQYGIKAASISGGQQTTTAATAAANSELVRRVQIAEEGDDSSGGVAPQLRLNLKGYAWMLNWVPYQQTGSSGTIARSELIKAIAQADPNGVLASNLSNVITNSDTVARYRPDLRPSWEQIQEIAAEGDSSGNRWVAGVYADRELYYKQAEAVDASGDPLAANNYGVLTRSIYDEGERYFDGGQEVQPWDLRPDRLVDLGGLSIRPEYVHQVVYTAPYGVQVRIRDANPLRGRLI